MKIKESTFLEGEFLSYIKNGIAVLLSISRIAGFIGSIFTISIAILAGYNFVLYTVRALYVVIIVLTVLSSMQTKQMNRALVREKSPTIY